MNGWRWACLIWFVVWFFGGSFVGRQVGLGWNGGGWCGGEGVAGGGEEEGAESAVLPAVLVCGQV